MSCESDKKDLAEDASCSRQRLIYIGLPIVSHWLCLRELDAIYLLGFLDVLPMEEPIKTKLPPFDYPFHLTSVSILECFSIFLGAPSSSIQSRVKYPATNKTAADKRMKTKKFLMTFICLQPSSRHTKAALRQSHSLVREPAPSIVA